LEELAQEIEQMGSESVESIDLSIPAQNRIRYAIRVLKGDVEGAAMMNDPFDVPKVLQ